MQFQIRNENILESPPSANTYFVIYLEIQHNFQELKKNKKTVASNLEKEKDMETMFSTAKR